MRDGLVGATGVQVEDAGGVAHFGALGRERDGIGHEFVGLFHRPTAQRKLREAHARVDGIRARRAHRLEVRARDVDLATDHGDFAGGHVRGRVAGLQLEQSRDRRARRLAIAGAPFELAKREQQARRVDAAPDGVVQHAARRAIVAGTRVQRRREVGEIGARRVRGEHRVDFAARGRGALARRDAAHQCGCAPDVIGVFAALAQQRHRLVGLPRL